MQTVTQMLQADTTGLLFLLHWCCLFSITLLEARSYSSPVGAWPVCIAESPGLLSCLFSTMLFAVLLLLPTFLLPSCWLRVTLYFLHKWLLDIDRRRKQHKGPLPVLLGLCRGRWILLFLHGCVPVTLEDPVHAVFAQITSLFLSCLSALIYRRLVCFPDKECLVYVKWDFSKEVRGSLSGKEVLIGLVCIFFLHLTEWSALSTAILTLFISVNSIQMSTLPDAYAYVSILVTVLAQIRHDLVDLKASASVHRFVFYWHQNTQSAASSLKVKCGVQNKAVNVS